MVGNTLQFAIVREDPKIESDLVSRQNENCSVLLIGSGGCTALSLQSEFPNASMTVLDPNPLQLDLIRKKVRTLSEFDSKSAKIAFGVGSDDPKSLTGCGNFESLFRSFRNFVYEFVSSSEDWLGFFTNSNRQVPFEETIFKSKYWTVAFQMFFSDPMLLAMFGKNAIQYAAPGSYPAYFQRVLEKGLLKTGAKTNYFLHHIFLGYYLDDPKCLPSYLKNQIRGLREFEYIETDAQNGPHFGRFDVISLSNIFDWMDKSDVAQLTSRLPKEMKSGAWIVYRQLNNLSDLRSNFGPAFRFDDQLAANLHTSDRSLFYSSLHIGQKISKG